MKGTLENLQKLGEGLDLDLFYDISLHHNDIRLQGAFHSNTVKALLGNGFAVNGYTANGYASFSKDDGYYGVVLTEKVD